MEGKCCRLILRWIASVALEVVDVNSYNQKYLFRSTKIHQIKWIMPYKFINLVKESMMFIIEKIFKLCCRLLTKTTPNSISAPLQSNQKIKLWHNWLNLLNIHTLVQKVKHWPTISKIMHHSLILNSLKKRNLLPSKK